MCGLWCSWGHQSSSAEERILRSLQNRGPDSHGVYRERMAGGDLSMVHTRLAIQDISEMAGQPMLSAGGRYIIVFNGEIYNYPELRHELLALGSSFRGHGDTEVLIEGFALWRDGLWKRLNGIFSVVIYDRFSGEITLARDRFGVKPLVWYRQENTFACGSELSAFRAAGVPTRPKLDLLALEEFWQWGSVQAPHTLIQGLEVFPPGCWGRWQAGSPGFMWKIQRYVDWPRGILTPNQISYPEAVDLVRSEFKGAIERQMLSDVPVGVFLSGGLDSASVLGLMASCSRAAVRTFSLGFSSSDLGYGVVDERSIAAETAHYFGADHCEIVLTAEDVLASLDEFCDAIDQPSVDGLNTFLVARAASSQGLKVAMSGLGGDELFAGYPVFQRAWRFESAPRTSAWIRSRLPWRVLQRLGWEHSRFVGGSLGALERHRRLQVGRHGMGISLLEEEEDLDLVAQLSRLEIRGYLANTLLRDSDAVTMHHGLELRVPFLDQELVSLILSLPSSYKMQAGLVKPLLRDSLGIDLPDAVLKAAKHGFELPFWRWLRDWPEPALSPEALGGPWPQRVRAARHLFGTRPNRYHGWWQWQILARWLMQWPALLEDQELWK